MKPYSESIQSSAPNRGKDEHQETFRMNSYNIAVIGGDGTGPEVAQESVKVLKVAAEKFGFGSTPSAAELSASCSLHSLTSTRTVQWW